jgi:hypothetical protein
LASNPDNGLLECYVEAVRRQSIAEQKEDEQQFTTRAAKASDMDLADQWAIYNAIYTELMASPDAFMRQLTVGFIRLMDEVRLEKRDEKAGGDRTRQRKDDAVTGDVFQHGTCSYHLDGRMGRKVSATGVIPTSSWTPMRKPAGFTQRQRAPSPEPASKIYL